MPCRSQVCNYRNIVLIWDATRNYKRDWRFAQSLRQSILVEKRFPQMRLNPENSTNIYFFWVNENLPFHPLASCMLVIHQKFIDLFSSFSLLNIYFHLLILRINLLNLHMPLPQNADMYLWSQFTLKFRIIKTDFQLFDH